MDFLANVEYLVVKLNKNTQQSLLKKKRSIQQCGTSAMKNRKQRKAKILSPPNAEHVVLLSLPFLFGSLLVAAKGDSTEIQVTYTWCSTLDSHSRKQILPRVQQGITSWKYGNDTSDSLML